MRLDTVYRSVKQSFVKIFVGISSGTTLENESYEAPSGKPSPVGRVAMETHCSTLYNQANHSPNLQRYQWLICMEYQGRCVMRCQYLIQKKAKVNQCY